MQTKTLVLQSVVLGALSLLVLGYNNCSPVEFANTPQASKAVEDLNLPFDSKVYEATVALLDVKTAPVDLVWVIDNSGSMNEEAAHVRSNFQAFISYIASRAALRLALISNPGTTGTAVSLPIMSASMMQINQSVNSRDGTALLASALCDTVNPPAACQSVKGGASIRGKLVNFLRPDSKKVFVFVTDDESDLSSTQFMDIVKATLPNQSVTISGFVALSREESPCLANPGQVYKDLAQATAGNIYNICSPDWAPAFGKLAEEVIRSVTKAISVPANVSSAVILAVYLDKVELTSSQYKFTSEGLVLDPSLTAGKKAAVLKIVYQ
jgi:hypothetical protein